MTMNRTRKFAAAALAHQADERVPLAPLEALCQLYADALVALSVDK